MTSKLPQPSPTATRKVRAMHGRGLCFAIAISAVLGAGSSASAQLTFNITNDAANPVSAQMLNGFQQAAAVWSSYLYDPITVNITVGAKTLATNQIGQTIAFFDPYAYSSVRAALVSDRTSGIDISSSNALQSGSTFSMLINRTANNPNGVVSATPYFDTGLGGPGQAGPENNSKIRLTSANAKALGLYPANFEGSDGTINFNTSKSYDFDRSNGINASQVDFVGVAIHEIGHLLGFMSGVDNLDSNATAPGRNDNTFQTVTALDLFRFSSRSLVGGPGVIDWTADSTTKYFSVDGGTTALATFSNGANFGGGGTEASHWKDNLALGIIDPSAASGELLLITNNDLMAFDVIGYNLVPVPEPSTCLALGLAGLGLARFRSHARRN